MCLSKSIKIPEPEQAPPTPPAPEPVQTKVARSRVQQERASSNSGGTLSQFRLRIPTLNVN